MPNTSACTNLSPSHPPPLLLTLGDAGGGLEGGCFCLERLQHSQHFFPPPPCSYLWSRPWPCFTVSSHSYWLTAEHSAGRRTLAQQKCGSGVQVGCHGHCSIPTWWMNIFPTIFCFVLFFVSEVKVKSVPCDKEFFPQTHYLVCTVYCLTSFAPSRTFLTSNQWGRNVKPTRFTMAWWWHDL